MQRLENNIDRVSSILDKNDLSFINQLQHGQTSRIRDLAKQKRNQYMKNKAYIRATIEIGNICANKCCYCGMSSENTAIKRYMLSEEIIIAIMDEVVRMGIGQVHIVGGESSRYDIRMLERVIQYANECGLAVTLVLGEKDTAFYSRMKMVGAKRYIIKFETSNVFAYQKAKGDKSLITRINHLFELKDLGFQIGTGIISGLPYTNEQDLVSDMAMLKWINPDMASCSMFSPNQESKYRDFPPGNIDVTLNTIALMRLLLKEDIYIPSSSGLGIQGQIDALRSGANVISVNMTPKHQADLFSMYKAKERAKRNMDDVLSIIKMAEMEVGIYV